LYTEGSKFQLISQLFHHTGGVTHIKFSHDGRYLFSGARKDMDILCWDIRKTGEILYKMQRQTTNNQKITFDIDASDRYLVTGSQNLNILVYDLKLSGTLVTQFSQHSDAVNGVAFHPTLPLLASSSGQRHFFLPSSKLNQKLEKLGQTPNALFLWKLPYSWQPSLGGQ